jgi:hypothetical protein
MYNNTPNTGSPNTPRRIPTTLVGAAFKTTSLSSVTVAIAMGDVSSQRESHLHKEEDDEEVEKLPTVAVVLEGSGDPAAFGR